MRFTSVILFLAFAMAHSVADTHHKRFIPQKRDIASELSTVKGGLLIKNGKQTSCELGLIDSNACFVSADCLDISSNPSDQTTKYEVILDAGMDGKSVRYDVDSIYIHTEYSPQTLANNIAVLQYNTKSSVTWINPVGVLREVYWEDMVYVRRSLKDLDKKEWEAPQFISTTDSDDFLCNSMSLVYLYNSYDYTCTHHVASLPSSALSDCDVPYGSVYTHMNGKLYFVGFYSHSAVSGEGKDLCSHKDISSYYTLVSNFMFFGASQTARKLDMYPVNSTLYPSLDYKYSMQSPKSADSLSDISVLGGNFYKYISSSNAEDKTSKTSTEKDEPEGMINTKDSDGTKGSDDTKDSDNTKSSDDASSSNNAKDPDNTTDSDYENISKYVTTSEGVEIVYGIKTEGTTTITYVLGRPGSVAPTSTSGISDSEAVNDKKNDGGSKTAIIAGICGTIGAVLLIVGCIYFTRFWRVYQQKRKVDPYSQTAMETILTEDLYNSGLHSGNNLNLGSSESNNAHNNGLRHNNYDNNRYTYFSENNSIDNNSW